MKQIAYLCAHVLAVGTCFFWSVKSNAGNGDWTLMAPADPYPEDLVGESLEGGMNLYIWCRNNSIDSIFFEAQDRTAQVNLLAQGISRKFVSWMSANEGRLEFMGRMSISQGKRALLTVEPDQKTLLWDKIRSSTSGLQFEIVGVTYSYVYPSHLDEFKAACGF